jgi:hypothetical protein
MLRAFRVTLLNISDIKIRLDDIFIRIPEGSEFDINWHVPMFILGGLGRDRANTGSIIRLIPEKNTTAKSVSLLDSRFQNLGDRLSP